MSKFANVVTIDLAAERRDQVVALLLAHKARCLRDEPDTLQFEVMLPKDVRTTILVYEVYRDAAAFEAHLKKPSLAQWREETAGMLTKIHGVRSDIVDERTFDDPTEVGALR
jgi:(4S)-4-hydroxy-5-phosphonooxypentane-2,3-dione isomerase